MTILGKVGELPSVCGRWPWPASVVSAGRWRPLHRPPPPSFPREARESRSVGLGRRAAVHARAASELILDSARYPRQARV